MTQPLSREIPLIAAQSVLLFIDVQNFSAKRAGAEFREIPKPEFQAKYGWYLGELGARIIPNMQRLQAAFRKAKVEVLYTTIESLTKDGRDRSLDYKITGFNVPKGSWDGKVIDELAPGDDEICLPNHRPACSFPLISIICCATSGSSSSSSAGS
jgi:ureidoacrylate peracid hydrolase